MSWQNKVSQQILKFHLISMELNPLHILLANYP